MEVNNTTNSMWHCARILIPHNIKQLFVFLFHLEMEMNETKRNEMKRKYITLQFTLVSHKTFVIATGLNMQSNHIWFIVQYQNTHVEHMFWYEFFKVVTHTHTPHLPVYITKYKNTRTQCQCISVCCIFQFCLSSKWKNKFYIMLHLKYNHHIKNGLCWLKILFAQRHDEHTHTYTHILEWWEEVYTHSGRSVKRFPDLIIQKTWEPKKAFS